MQGLPLGVDRPRRADNETPRWPLRSRCLSMGRGRGRMGRGRGRWGGEGGRAGGAAARAACGEQGREGRRDGLGLEGRRKRAGWARARGLHCSGLNRPVGRTKRSDKARVLRYLLGFFLLMKFEILIGLRPFFTYGELQYCTNHKLTHAHLVRPVDLSRVARARATT